MNLVYLAARDQYRIEREEKAGIGYVDFIFYPEIKSADAVILELKVGSTPKRAIQQIKDKNYTETLKDYSGQIILAGINYNKKTKKHECIIINKNNSGLFI